MEGLWFAPAVFETMAPSLEDMLLSDSYDEVRYPSLARNQTHPAHVAALTKIAGFQVPPIEHWRVLEIGCGNGANLLPLACDYPEARFVGVDRARVPIESARTFARDLGLSNIELHALDLLDFQPDGEFDYIVAHGVYSWVPPGVRDRILQICGAALKPQGLAYISYNALPGGHFRRIVWDLFRFHLRGATSPSARTEGAREAARLTLNGKDPDALVEAVRKEMTNLLDRDPAALYHDDLADPNESFYLLDFVRQAAGHGLQYLGDAEPRRDDVHALVFHTDDWLDARQYGDFQTCRRFRETLLCRQGIVLDRKISLERFRDLFAASRATPSGPEEGGRQKFDLPKSRSLTTNHPIAKDLLRRLSSLWPDSARVPDLPFPDFPPDDVADVLMRLLEGGAIELRSSLPRIAGKVGERPAVSALVRLQIAAGCRTITNQRHQNIELKDDIARTLVSLLDGSRDREALRRALASAGADSGQVESLLEEKLGELHRLCLLTE